MAVQWIQWNFSTKTFQDTGKTSSLKIAGVDNPLRRGKLYGWKGYQTSDELMNFFMDTFAQGAVNGKAFTVPNGNLPAQTVNGAHVTPEGLDMAQLGQKFLQGAVGYSQTARDYLSTDLGAKKGLNADNTKPAKQGAPYTAMEHHWDEGFGYWGAAKDYLAYSDLAARTKRSIDTNNDGLISIGSEKNLGKSANTARVDLTAADQDMDLSREMMEAFLKGRELMVKKPADYKKYVVANAQVILTGYEKTFAAITIHYINRTITEMQEYGTEGYLFKDFAKFWGEMKGFGLAFQFSPKALLSDADFDKVHALMGDKPVLPHAPQAQVNSYIADLLTARGIMAKAYSFSDNNVVNW